MGESFDVNYLFIYVYLYCYSSKDTMDVDVIEDDDLLLDELMMMWDRGTHDKAQAVNGEI